MELREAVELAKRWRETWMVEDDQRFKSSAPEITEALTLLIDAAEKSSPPPDAAIVEKVKEFIALLDETSEARLTRKLFDLVDELRALAGEVKETE